MQQKYDDQYINKIRGRVTEDHLLNHVIELKEKRSITPDTHKSRTIVENEKELINFASIKGLDVITKQISSDLEKELVMSQKEPDNLFYVDEYQYKNSKTSHVFRFSINTLYKFLKEEVINYNQTVKKAITQDLTDKITDKVQKFFISIAKNTDLKTSEDVLKQFEKYLKKQKKLEKMKKF